MDQFHVMFHISASVASWATYFNINTLDSYIQITFIRPGVQVAGYQPVYVVAAHGDLALPSAAAVPGNYFRCFPLFNSHDIHIFKSYYCKCWFTRRLSEHIFARAIGTGACGGHGSHRGHSRCTVACACAGVLATLRIRLPSIS